MWLNTKSDFKKKLWNLAFFGQKKSADIEPLQARESLIDQSYGEKNSKCCWLRR